MHIPLYHISIYSEYQYLYNIGILYYYIYSLGVCHIYTTLSKYLTFNVVLLRNCFLFYILKQKKNQQIPKHQNKVETPKIVENIVHVLIFANIHNILCFLNVHLYSYITIHYTNRWPYKVYASFLVRYIYRKKENVNFNNKIKIKKKWKEFWRLFNGIYYIE